VIVLMLIALLWIAVLVPMAVAKLRERRSALAVGEFHHRLELLERTGPKLIEPAYRLADRGAGQAEDPIVVASPPPPRSPNLRLVPPLVDTTVAIDREASAGGQLMVHELDDEKWPDADPIDTELERLEWSVRRGLARRRRLDIFAGLCGLGSLTGLIGVAPPLRGAWYLCAADVCALVGFVGLAAYGQWLEAEKDHLKALVNRVKAEEGSLSTVRHLGEVDPNESDLASEVRHRSTSWRMVAEA
jgi:hypothetical protein